MSKSHVLFSGSTALDRILSYKQEEVVAAKVAIPLAHLDSRAKSAPAPRGFAAALAAYAAIGENGLICELKRRSPSAGEILPGADPVLIAREYEAGGVPAGVVHAAAVQVRAGAHQGQVRPVRIVLSGGRNRALHWPCSIGLYR